MYTVLTRIALFLGISTLPFVTLAQQPPTQAPPQHQMQAPPAPKVTDKDKKNFQKAFPKVAAEIQKRDEQIESIDNPQEDRQAVKEIQETSYKNMVAIIEKHGLTVDKFNLLTQQRGTN